MEFRKATEDDIEAVMSLVNRAYHVTETGSTGVAFKSTPRYSHWRNSSALSGRRIGMCPLWFHIRFGSFIGHTIPTFQYKRTS